LNTSHYIRALRGILWRELLRFVKQRERFFAALVRPLVWLFIFATGFRAAVDFSIMPPYQTYITYDEYVVPGLIGMIQLFNGMQSSLSMVYDREMGSMRVLLTSPLPRWYLLTCRLLSSVFVSTIQVYTFLAIAYLYGISIPPLGHIAVLPALVLSGTMLGALGLLLSSRIHQLENFAGVMNFIIFPMFFASSALYPLWKFRESSVVLYEICRLNPFNSAIELIRFSLYLEWNFSALAAVLSLTAVFLGAAIWAYDPALGIQGRRGASGGSG
jgi:ABC-2 type transport system permease protein